MSSTRFEPEGSSAGRRLCIQVYYVYMHQYKHSSTYKTA